MTLGEMSFSKNKLTSISIRKSRCTQFSTVAPILRREIFSWIQDLTPGLGRSEHRLSSGDCYRGVFAYLIDQQSLHISLLGKVYLNTIQFPVFWPPSLVLLAINLLFKFQLSSPALSFLLHMRLPCLETWHILFSAKLWPVCFPHTKL